MVVLVVFAVIGIAATFAVGYYAVSTKFPKVGEKTNDFVGKVFRKFKKEDSNTVSELDKLDK